ncbi:MAG: phosphohydrolase [Spirochaetales bacterium]|nr:phosphohydrolase [Spirochaetales bacterium]
MHSVKEQQLNERIERRLTGLALKAYRLVKADPEIEALQDYANTVSIKRLGYNDHGPVHMRKVTSNAIKLANILHEAKIPLSLENEEVGVYEDSLVVIVLSAFLHDVGMSLGRAFHENTGIWLAQPILERVLAEIYPDQIARRVIARSLAMECIMGHMATIPIHSAEAGIILVADGCDMEKGRARIPMMLATGARLGDIHKYSALAIDRVKITEGEKKPVRIEVHMTENAGFFQVEEVLSPKIKASPIRHHVELWALQDGREPKCYL